MMLGVFGGGRKKESVEEVDNVSLLAVRSHENAIKIAAKFEGKTWMELSKFAREKGYVRREELLSLLFTYGVSEREGVDNKKRHSEMFTIGGKYASMKFEAYRLFNDNKALALKLSAMVPDNRRLRKDAAERGLILDRREEWDDWDQEVIDRFYRWYVFIK
jgi:hypothetical protein